MATKIEECQACRFYSMSGASTGLCRRYPPSFRGHDDFKLYPMVYADSWCGEYQSLAPPDENEAPTTIGSANI